jgi:hypothetical protein
LPNPLTNREARKELKEMDWKTTPPLSSKLPDGRDNLFLLLQKLLNRGYWTVATPSPAARLGPSSPDNQNMLKYPLVFRMIVRRRTDGGDER